MALRCPQCDHEYYTPHTRVVPDWLRDHARRNIVDHAQAESVCQTITEARAELLQYDSHIARLRATLTQLENERAGLQDFVSHHETLPSPIRRVPTEVLTLIFAECCEDDDVLYTNISMTILRLGLVCHRWRPIVLTRPSLWSSIRIFIDVPANELSPRDRTRINQTSALYVRRSKNLPLTIDYTGDTDVVFGDLFQRRVRERVKHLRLQLPRQGSSQRTALLYPRTEGSRYPSLESVELYSTGEQAATGEWYQELEAFCWAPCLRTIAFGRVSTPFLMNFLECEVDTRIHLRHLVLKDFIGRMWFIPEFLNHLNELEHLTLEITNQTYWTQSRSGVAPPVYCERLTSLSLALGANMTGTHLINLLKVPCLASLEIYNPEDGQCEIAGAIDSLVGLVRRSSSTLKTLVVRNVFMVGIHLLLLLELAPGIQSLVVHEGEDAPFSTITDRLLLWLTIKSDSRSTKPILPQLIDIQFLFDTKVSEKALTRMIESRCTQMQGGESMLLASAELGIRAGRELRKETIEQLNDFRRNGLRTWLM